MNRRQISGSIKVENLSFFNVENELMDKLDGQLLNMLQNAFPLVEKPYEKLSSKLEISSDQLWKRVLGLMDDGIIRRVGVSLNSHKFGFCSTLVAISVGGELVEEAAEVVGRYPEITHSYLRNDKYNIWFTIIAPDAQRMGVILGEIQAALSLEDSQVLNLPMRRLFKLKACFDPRS